MLTPAITIGVSLKMYFGHAEATTWFGRVADAVRTHRGIASGAVRLIVIPTYLQVLPALETFAASPVLVGAQDVAAADSGACTGEVSAAELAEVGVSFAEIGHAERRSMFGETDEIVATKASAALRNGLTPLLCVGETSNLTAADATAATVAQMEAGLAGAPDGAVIVAYEPVWAIGAAEPAPREHIARVCTGLLAALGTLPGRSGSAVIYGGSAGPGLLTGLGDAVDGLFLGRFAHDVDALVDVLDEASALAERRSGARA
ncbi:triose-phosphate isomerase family protein [Humibacter sp. RRB41]|uniref:triose-phosphate isomerase family protein n=1 Tax=Humibacter sp. RRB41 TaxID=2919946 RepID=UPI0027E2B93D|nr:triose-phosphate isomerase family protein [Humibacter sp. RRB41]